MVFFFVCVFLGFFFWGGGGGGGGSCELFVFSGHILIVEKSLGNSSVIKCNEKIPPKAYIHTLLS